MNKNSEAKGSSAGIEINAASISLPKGGGAIKGIGDTFQSNALSGTGSYSIPIVLTPARGFEPQLSLNYESGSGNDVFGLGFSVSLQNISRKTDTGIPKYSEDDTFDSTDDGELTPKFIEENGQLVPEEVTKDDGGVSWNVRTFLPIQQSSFSLIEQWINPSSAESWWKVTDKNNATFTYGKNKNARIADPDDETKIFEWLIEEAVDNKGNKILYGYKPEDAKNISNKIYDVNRSLHAKKYIQSIQYGNYFSGQLSEAEKFAFEVVFDYGEYDLTGLDKPGSDPYRPVREWAERSDPFSRYRSGFEIRTLRLCRGVLVFHTFDELGSDPCLVKALQLAHDQTPVFSFLKSAIQTGYRINQDGSYACQSLPAAEFDYSSFSPALAPAFKELTISEADAFPGYLEPSSFQPIDLKGEGLPGMLLSTAETTLYYEPLGDGAFQPSSELASFPITRNFKNPAVSLQSLDANGQLELVVSSPQVAGYFDQRYDGSWSPFHDFQSVPTDFTNPHCESVDLDGNGKADLLVFHNPDLLFYLSEGKAGYGAPQTVPLPAGFPASANYLETELVTFADLFGDGLSHRVRIRDGSAEVWPNLGYGHFGEKVNLSNAPRFDKTTTVSSIFLADVDGSGTADLIFAYADRVEIYLNRAGNSFADTPLTLYLPSNFGEIDRIRFADILGEGTSALVFTKAGPQMRHWYYNFCGEREETLQGQTVTKPALKPYLLTKIDNNLGAVTDIYYSSSTNFYLEDKKNGRPWASRLPFPVQVVEKSVTTDEISGSRLTSAYKYHDGYFDPLEREFRGFGFVESWDTENFEDYTKSASNPAFPSNRLNEELYVPPVYTKTWHHTGACIENAVISKQYKKEYYSGDKDAYDFPDSAFNPEVYQSGTETILQAYAALKGTVMRTEIYALDDSPLQGIPYTVSESNFTVELIQPVVDQHHAAFLTTPRESIFYHYERNPNDPRVQQEFTLEVDLQCGEIKKSCSVFLPRRPGNLPIYPEQIQLKATAAYNHHINTADTDSYRYRGVLCQNQTFEVFGLDLNGKQYCSFADVMPVQAAIDNPLPYQSALTPGKVQAQQLTWERSFFWNEDQSDALPLQAISSRALVHHNEKATFTKEFVAEVFGPQLVDETIQSCGGYFYDLKSGYWWNKGLVQHYYSSSQPQSYYLPCKTENSFVDPASSLFVKTIVAYDQPYQFTIINTTQYIDETNPDPDKRANTQTASIDYLTLQPYQLIDINGNIAQAIFDPLGQVIVTTLFGLEDGNPVGGMRLYAYDGKPAEYVVQSGASFEAILDDPQGAEKYLQGAVSYFYYNLQAWKEEKQPPCAINLLRDRFYHSGQNPAPFDCKIAINYSDGFARKLESKLKTDARWSVSGRTVYNNKGKPCEQYFPYFSDSPLYESQQEIIDQQLVPSPTVSHYDPLLRIIRIDTPKGFFSKIEFTPWDEKHYDQDDTVIDSAYYIGFMGNYPANPTQQEIDEKDALTKAAAFYDTPGVKILDSVGNKFLHVQVEADKRQLIAYTQTDIQNRLLLSIDPRLFKSNQTQATNYYNFKYRYAMGQKDPVYVDSVDAGTERHLSNIFGNQLWSLSARQYCQLISYDRLNRCSALCIKKLPNDDPITSYADFNLVEVFVYGETQPLIPHRNLRGQLYKLNDLSGIAVNSQFGLQGELLETSRQMVTDYKAPIDWNSHPLPVLENEVFTSRYSYNALKLLISETTPDGSVTANTYEQAGRLSQVDVTFGDQSKHQVIQQIDYDANGQRIRIQYGNGITSNYSYELTTQRLLGLLSTRQGTFIETVQDINYTYDPVGNITRSWNNTFKTVFHNNQKVDPLSDYTYDALYRLTNVNGRQHPGINADTYKNNITAGDFKQAIFSQLPDVNDADKLENYSEIYTYDDSGNLVNKQHVAASSSWAKSTPVEDDSNRLKDLGPDAYDASGNLRQLEISNTVALSYNCCENLVKAGVIERPEELDDCDYYVYGSNEQRTRKVSERMASGGAVTLIEDKLYLGNYQIKRNISVNAQGAETISMERQTLRVMDGSTCVLIMHYCVTGAQAGTRSLRFQVGDNLGSITSEYDRDAQLISYEEYFPYGGTAIIAGPNQAEVKLKDYRYSGKELDDSTGLYYYGARYYAPWLGRWLSPDPAGTVDGMNLYAFVGGNPITHVDVGGMAKKKPQATSSSSSSPVSNPFEWQVKHTASYLTSDTDLTSILDHFGEPTTSVVKTYTDLADRIDFDLKGGGKALASTTLSDMHLALEASKPLHFQFNDLLGSQWRESMEDYTGSKRKIPLYSVMRSKTTSFFQSVDVDTNISSVSLNDHLKAISGRPAEVHHILFKAIYPEFANQTSNMMLTQRSTRESVYGPGQHELMHMVFSGNSSNKFRVLPAPLKDVYVKWYGGKMQVSSIQ
ncbi:RHS repeat-associated core domain-containing protein [Nitrosospira sp. Nsp18]|uniref:SpvB/TcaC N-terminal domain-containing protein n=1 Tax=Nitrosospira sp. Nsp18 TaxID=1855334 RepID=UPI00088D70FE|nr:SpvB/TcaC N-terminal domain-containing protein [Nitrosospira sp. Nsp18]SDA19794.1 RHS repeat-associated core domain-containing protein [Nitrosospira sp. Nsp18]